MDPKPDELSAEWYVLGEDDFRNADILMKNGGSSRAVCFLSQQAAEKYLKGFLVDNKRGYRLTHDLYIILKDCAVIDKGFLVLRDCCTFLSTCYIESRYPTGIEEYGTEQARQALSDAQEIIRYVKGREEKRK